MLPFDKLNNLYSTLYTSFIPMTNKSMKSVTIGRCLEVNTHTCNFCQKDFVSCVQGELETKMYKKTKVTDERIIKGHAKATFFPSKFEYKIEDYDFASIPHFEEVETKLKTSICENCIKDLYKQLNSK